MENLGFRFSRSHSHLVYEQEEVWKVCYFVRMRIMIVVGRWNCLLFACKLGFFLKSVEVANGCGPFVRFVC